MMTDKKLRLIREHLVSINEILDSLPLPAADQNHDGTTTVSYPAPAPPEHKIEQAKYRHDPTLVITDVQDAGMALIKAGKRWRLEELLEDMFSATRISDLKRDQWEEFIDSCNAEGP